jgi:MYXO-CTERM domain-containing protein
MRIRIVSFFLTAVFGLSAVAPSEAAILDPATLMDGSAGATASSVWTNLSAVAVEAQTGLDFPGHPGSGAWPGNVPNQSGTANSAYLTKVANAPSIPAKAPYFAGVGPFTGTTSPGRMHFAGFSTTPNTLAGSLGVGSTAALSGVNNIVFQIEIAEVFGHTFFNNVLPSLNYNGGSQALAATRSKLLSSTVGPAFGGDTTTIHTWLLQWDATALGAIGSFQINFSGVEHSDIYGLRLDQYENYLATPEPSSWALAAMGLVGAIAGMRRRRR